MPKTVSSSVVFTTCLKEGKKKNGLQFSIPSLIYSHPGCLFPSESYITYPTILPAFCHVFLGSNQKLLYKKNICINVQNLKESSKDFYHPLRYI